MPAGFCTVGPDGKIPGRLRADRLGLMIQAPLPPGRMLTTITAG